MNMHTSTRDAYRCPSTAAPRGMALVVVLAVVGLASIIGFAMLSSTAMQSQASQNASSAAEGDYLAESAVQAALYYLQHPHLIPPGWGDTPGYYLKASNQSLGRDAIGSFDLTVTPAGERDVYQIRASARSQPTAPSRVITARAQVNRATISHAITAGGNITLPLGLKPNGSVIANGTITNLTGLALTLISGPIPASSYQPPSAMNVNYYGADRADRAYTMPDGTIGYAEQLTAAPTTPPVASSNNPGRVFFYKNATVPDLVMTTAVTINGTIVVKDGGLSVRANGITINPESGMPALVVDRDLNIYRANVRLTPNGVVWVGGNITWTGLLNTGSSLNVDGALVLPSGSHINAPFTGGVGTVTYNVARAQVPDLSRTLQPGQSVRILAWND